MKQLPHNTSGERTQTGTAAMVLKAVRGMCTASLYLRGCVRVDHETLAKPRPASTPVFGDMPSPPRPETV